MKNNRHYNSDHHTACSGAAPINRSCAMKKQEICRKIRGKNINNFILACVAVTLGLVVAVEAQVDNDTRNSTINNVALDQSTMLRKCQEELEMADKNRNQELDDKEYADFVNLLLQDFLFWNTADIEFVAMPDILKNNFDSFADDTNNNNPVVLIPNTNGDDSHSDEKELVFFEEEMDSFLQTFCTCTIHYMTKYILASTTAIHHNNNDDEDNDDLFFFCPSDESSRIRILGDELNFVAPSETLDDWLNHTSFSSYNRTHTFEGNITNGTMGLDLESLQTLMTMANNTNMTEEEMIAMLNGTDLAVTAPTPAAAPASSNGTDANNNTAAELPSPSVLSSTPPTQQPKEEGVEDWIHSVVFWGLIIGAIVGGFLGSFVLQGILICCGCCCFKKKKQQEEPLLNEENQPLGGRKNDDDEERGDWYQDEPDKRGGDDNNSNEWAPSQEQTSLPSPGWADANFTSGPTTSSNANNMTDVPLEDDKNSKNDNAVQEDVFNNPFQ